MENVRESRLVVTDVRVEDSGRFECVAENPAGKVAADFTLQVRKRIDRNFSCRLIDGLFQSRQAKKRKAVCLSTTTTKKGFNFQVGFFVGGVASLESGEIAGIAMAFAVVAVVLLVVVVGFAAKRKFCSPRGREMMANNVVVESKTPPTKSAIVVNGNDKVDFEPTKATLTRPEPQEEIEDGTIVINGTKYQMPQRRTNFPHLYTNRLSADALYPPQEANDPYLPQTTFRPQPPHMPSTSSPIVTHRDLLDRFNVHGGGRSSSLGGYYSPQVHHRPMMVTTPERHHYANVNSKTLPHLVSPRHYPADFGLPKVQRPLKELREVDDEQEAEEEAVVNARRGQRVRGRSRDSPDEGIQDDCSTDV